ncbi:MAG: DUF2232 domain-containing protein [Syntrophobacteraceae bacterium]
MNEIREDLPFRPPGGNIKEFLILTGLTVALFLSGLFMIFTPAPSALAVLRRVGSKAWAVPACSAFLGVAIFSTLSLPELGPYLLLIAMGSLIGYGCVRGWTAEKTVGLSSLLVIGVTAFFVLIAYIQTKGQMVHLMEQYIRGAITQVMKQFSAGSPAKNEELKKSLLEMVPQVVALLPGMFVSCTLLISWLNLLICRRYCGAGAPQLCREQDLSLWKSPEHLVWAAIVSGFLLLVPWNALSLVGSNLIRVVGTIYFFQGIAIVAFYFQRSKIPLFVKALMYGLLFMTDGTRIGVAALGLFDVWFDFRKLNKQA